jgi:hypothetical protein
MRMIFLLMMGGIRIRAPKMMMSVLVAGRNPHRARRWFQLSRSQRRRLRDPRIFPLMISSWTPLDCGWSWILTRSGFALRSRFLRARANRAASAGLQHCVGKTTMDDCIGPWSPMPISNAILFEYVVSLPVGAFGLPWDRQGNCCCNF